MHAIAVVFNFVERLVALRRGVDQLSQLRADPSPFTCAESWTTIAGSFTPSSVAWTRRPAGVEPRSPSSPSGAP